MASTEMAALSALGRVMLSIVAVQTLGYTLKANRALPTGAEAGIGFFLGTVSLPALTFRALATIDFFGVQWVVAASVVVGKAALVGFSAALARLTNPDEAEMAGGVVALLVTNSDDIGLGVPTFSALFSPTLVNMLFVLNVAQSMVINPLCFALLGVGAAREAQRKLEPAPGSGGGGTDGVGAGSVKASASTPASASRSHSVAHDVLRGVASHPLTQSVAAGFAYNAVVHGLRGSASGLFWPLEDLCTLLGRAFTPLVLFLAGSASVGAFAQLASLWSATPPLLLVCLKSLLLPAALKMAVRALGGSREVTDYAFCFGTLPAAASCLVFASAFSPSPALLRLLNATLALGKTVGFGLLLLSAAVLRIGTSAEVAAINAAVGLACRLLSIAGLTWLAASTLWVHAWRRFPMLLGLVRLAWLDAALRLAAPLLPPTVLVDDGRIAFVTAAAVRWAVELSVGAIGVAEAYDVARAAWSRFTARSERNTNLGSPLMPTASDMWEEAPPDVSRSRAFRHDVAALPWLAVVAALALALTLPWSLSAPIPARTPLPLLAPYGGSQSIVYAAVYSLLAAAHLGAICVLLLRETSPGRDWCVVDFRLRLDVVLIAGAIAAAAAAAVCAQLSDPPDAATNADSDALCGSMALLLLLRTLAADGLGFVLFLLFGLQPALVAAPTRAVLRAWEGAAAAVSWARRGKQAPSGPTPLRHRSRSYYATRASGFVSIDGTRAAAELPPLT